MKKRKRKAPSIGKVAKKTVSNLSKKAFDRMYPRSKSDKQKTNAAGEKSGGGFYGEGLNAPVGYAEGFGDVQLPKPKQPRIKGKKRGKYKARGGSILRAGKTALKGGNRALARFIAARYSPKAIAKYQDYAGRLRRSKRLIAQIVKIDDNTFRIRKYIIKTDTAGNNPYSCTCPDFSQFSSDARNWLGSKAGPFNPCKHMMAVRDRRYSCIDGECSPRLKGEFATEAECVATGCDPHGGGSGGGGGGDRYSIFPSPNGYLCLIDNPSGTYASLSACNAAKIPPAYPDGCGEGQCIRFYNIKGDITFNGGATATRNTNTQGPITNPRIDSNGYGDYYVYWTDGSPANRQLYIGSSRLGVASQQLTITPL